MILTCPSCSTQYVVKDQAIPSGGRKVRCAACKHSWFEEGEATVADEAHAEAGEPVAMATSAGEEESGGGAAEDAAADVERVHGGNPLDQIVKPVGPAEFPAPQTDDGRRWEPVAPAAGFAPLTPEPDMPDPMQPAAEEFEPFYEHEPIEQPKRLWPWLVAVVLLVALAAVAFSLLAPAELRQRLGLASAAGSELEIVLTTRNRQALASGNELFTVSGRIINSTDAPQTVPPLYAELLDGSREKVVHRWTISPPATSLAPGTSASFNSAELGVPEEGKYLRMRLGGPDA